MTFLVYSVDIFLLKFSSYVVLVIFAKCVTLTFPHTCNCTLDHSYIPPLFGVGSSVGDTPIAVDGVYRTIVGLLSVDVVRGVPTAGRRVDRKWRNRWSAFVDVVVVQEGQLVMLGVRLCGVELLGYIVVY